MLKLLNKYSVSSALAAAVVLGSSQAFGTLNFILTGPGGATTITPTPNTTITLTLSYSIDNPTNSGVFDVGGSFLSTDSSGGGTFQNPVLGANFTGAGSQIGSSAGPTIWGDIANPFDTAALFYARSNVATASSVVLPVPGATGVLGTIDYAFGNTPNSSFTLSFVPRDRAGIYDQIWQENGVGQDDTTVALGTSAAVSVGTGPAISTWSATVAGSNLDTPGNWTPNGTPNSTTAQVVFGGGGSTGTISSNVPHTYNNMTFNSNATYTISGAGSITLAGTNPTISVNAGAHVITAPFLLTPSGLTKSGAGSIAVNNLRTAGTVSINGGTLQINSAGGTAGMSKIGGLSLSGGVLDLVNNSIVISGSSVGAVNGFKSAHTLIASGATANVTTLAVASGADATINNVLGGFLNGQPYTSTDTLVKFTYFGDANFDGKTTFADFLILQANFNKPGVWDQGDFNGDGSVTFADFLLLQANFNKTPTLSAGELSQITSFEAVAVPEPASLAIMGLGVIGLLARRRR